jgi:outer membrane protein
MKRDLFKFALCIPLAAFITFLLHQNIYALQHEKLALSLENAMDLAESYSLAVKSAQENENIAQFQERIAKQDLLPKISFNANYMFNDSHVNALVANPLGTQMGLPDKVTSTGTFVLNQPILNLFSLYQNIEKTAAQTQAALKNKNLTKENARFYGAQAFINAQKAHQLLKTALSALAVSQKQLQDAQAQFQAGKLTHADLLKFKLNLEYSNTNLIQADTTHKMALFNLFETIGIQNSNVVILLPAENSLFKNKKLENKDLKDFMLEAFEKRLDLLMSHDKLYAIQREKMQSIEAYIPSLNFVANYTRNFKAQNLNLNGVIFPKERIQDSFSYGVQFQWTLLDWGIRNSHIEVALATEQKAKNDLDSLKSKIRIDVTNSYYQLKDAIQVLDSAKISVQYAQDVYSQMKARFDIGQITATDLISSSNDQTTARANFANANGALDLAWINFQKSRGEKL